MKVVMFMRWKEHETQGKNLLIMEFAIQVVKFNPFFASGPFVTLESTAFKDSIHRLESILDNTGFFVCICG